MDPADFQFPRLPRSRKPHQDLPTPPSKATKVKGKTQPSLRPSRQDHPDLPAHTKSKASKLERHQDRLATAPSNQVCSPPATSTMLTPTNPKPSAPLPHRHQGKRAPLKSNATSPLPTNESVLALTTTTSATPALPKTKPNKPLPFGFKPSTLTPTDAKPSAALPPTTNPSIPILDDPPTVPSKRLQRSSMAASEPSHDLNISATSSSITFEVTEDHHMEMEMEPVNEAADSAEAVHACPEPEFFTSAANLQATLAAMERHCEDLLKFKCLIPEELKANKMLRFAFADPPASILAPDALIQRVQPNTTATVESMDPDSEAHLAPTVDDESWVPPLRLVENRRLRIPYFASVSTISSASVASPSITLDSPPDSSPTQLQKQEPASMLDQPISNYSTQVSASAPTPQNELDQIIEQNVAETQDNDEVQEQERALISKRPKKKRPVFPDHLQANSSATPALTKKNAKKAAVSSQDPQLLLELPQTKALERATPSAEDATLELCAQTSAETASKPLRKKKQPSFTLITEISASLAQVGQAKNSSIAMHVVLDVLAYNMANPTIFEGEHVINVVFYHSFEDVTARTMQDAKDYEYAAKKASDLPIGRLNAVAFTAKAGSVYRKLEKEFPTWMELVTATGFSKKTVRTATQMSDLFNEFPLLQLCEIPLWQWYEVISAFSRTLKTHKKILVEKYKAWIERNLVALGPQRNAAEDVISRILQPRQPRQPRQPCQPCQPRQPRQTRQSRQVLQDKVLPKRSAESLGLPQEETPSTDPAPRISKRSTRTSLHASSSQPLASVLKQICSHFPTYAALQSSY